MSADAGRMTARKAAEFAGVSVSTLRRYTCGWCGQTLLRKIQGQCSAIYDGPCDPKQFPWEKFRDEVAGRRVAEGGGP